MKSFKGIFSIVILVFFIFLIGCATMEKGSGERVRLKEPRIKPVPESEWNADQEKILKPLKKVFQGDRKDERVINVFTTLARNPQMTARWLPFAAYIAGRSTLVPREREILILRISWLCGSEYQFGQHTLVGKSAGLTNEEIRRITQGPKAAGWDAFDATLLRATDELYYDAFITDGTWNALAKRYNQQQLIDVVATVGEYNLSSMLSNSLGMQLDEGVPGFPKGKDK